MSESNSIGKVTTIDQIIEKTHAKSKERKTGDMGKDEFLNLLVTQLKYQDPLNPVDDKEFLGQMAQFSSLEQMQNMNESFSSVKAFGLIGKYVSAEYVDEQTRESKAVQGEVSSVKMANGKIFAIVDGEDVPIDGITDVMNTDQAPASKNISSYTGLIGYNVNGTIHATDSDNKISVRGKVRELVKGEHENYAVLDDVNVNVVNIYSSTPLGTAEEKANYLDQKLGKEVSFKAIDPSTNLTSDVTGKLYSYEISENGKVKAVLDDVTISIETISKISE